MDRLLCGDSFGRSILMLGEHVEKNELNSELITYPKRKKQNFSLFFDTPSFTLNNFSVSIFNKLYFNSQKTKNLFTLIGIHIFILLTLSAIGIVFTVKKVFFNFNVFCPINHQNKGIKKYFQLSEINLLELFWQF